MMPKLYSNPGEIKKLLSMLKSETPEYPADLLAARKSAFLKHAAAININFKGQSGSGGQQAGGGGSGSALGGSTTAQGIAFQALIGIGLVAAVLIGSFLFRDLVTGLIDENVAGGQLHEPAVLSTPIGLAASTAVPPTEIPSTIPTPRVGTPTIKSTPTVVDILNGAIINESESPGAPKPNPGLHLGQTPGTPAAPGQGNPGNINKPDKPDKDKPDKDKPENPNRPGK
jgi:hypothetical protein